MKKTVFIVEELRTDFLENDVDQARYYVPVGFVEHEAVAQRMVDEAGLLPKGTMWAIYEDTPRKRYKAISSLDSPAEPERK